MTDAYIESAMMSLTTAWSDSGNGMSITCPQLTDYLTQLSRQIKALYDEQALARTQIEKQNGLVEMMKSELSTYKQRYNELQDVVTNLTSESTGFVRNQLFNETVTKLSEKTVVNNLKDDVRTLQSQVASVMAVKRDVEDLQRDIRSLEGTVDDHHHDIIEDTGALRRMTAQFESDTRKQLSELESRTGHHETDINRKVERLIDQVESDRKHFSNEITLVEKKATEQLEAHSEEIVNHLKLHAETIEALQADRQERNRRMPTQHEVAQLRSDMDGVRNEITEAQFRVQEVYSQCLAMYSGSAVMVNRGKDRKASPDSPQDYSSRSHVDGSSSLLAEAQNVLSSVHATAGSRDGLPTSVELQVDLLKKDVHRVVTIAMPSCIEQVQLLKDQVEAVARLSQRAELAFKGLAQCVGLRDEGDELLASLIQQDYNKAILQLRTAMGTIAAGVYDYPSSPARSKTKTSASTGFGPDTYSTGATPLGVPPTEGGLSGVTPWSSSNDQSAKVEGYNYEYDERYSVLPQLAALKADRFNVKAYEDNNKKKGAPQLGLDCADTIGADGVQIMHVVASSPAQKAGLSRSDRIVAVNDRSVKNCTEFLHALSTSFILASAKTPGGTRVVRFTVVGARGGEPREVKLELS